MKNIHNNLSIYLNMLNKLYYLNNTLQYRMQYMLLYYNLYTLSTLNCS